MKRKILVLGSGGREHAIAWKLKQSSSCEALYIAPGNAGTATVGTNIDLDPLNFEHVGEACLAHGINLLVVGPEDPLVKGIRDYFSADPRLAGIPMIGPGKNGAILEGSKAYSKEFMQKYAIPTAAYRNFKDGQYNEAVSFLETLSAPYVLKADGLAAGKGVVIATDLETAKSELKEFFDGKFGDASRTVVIEEFLSGIEVSVFVLCDGKDYIVLPEAKDYKRIGEGDTGLNTGGMGAISPVPFAGAEFMKKVDERIIKPTVNGLKKESVDYKGFIFIGLMNVNGEPFVIEYNCRMGDPETEAVMTRIDSDLVEVFEAVAEERLANFELKISEQTAATVIVVSGGYPGSYEKGKIITGFEATGESIVFHSGTKVSGGNVVSNGGRVLAVTSLGNSIQEAVTRSINAAAALKFEGSYYRRDIGKDLMQKS